MEIESTLTKSEISVVILGATGAVGGETLETLLQCKNVSKISLLGRRPVEDIKKSNVVQHEIDIFDPSTYNGLLEGHNVAICTLGVGEPSKISKEDFLKIDKVAVLDFAIACKKAGVKHFELLSSVGINAKSSQYYLRAKGELVEELKALNFERLSIFKPSMILTPTNRYGISQGIILFIWPIINPFLFSVLKKYRGIKVEKLGSAIAKNIYTNGTGLEYLEWADFQRLDAINS